MSLILSLIPEGPDEPCACEQAEPTRVPKPSDISFRRAPQQCEPTDDSDTRLLVIRKSSRFRINGAFYTMVIWCRPADDCDTAIDSLPTIDELTVDQFIDTRSGAATTFADGACFLVQWHVVRADTEMPVMCDVLINEYDRNRNIPLQLYTPVVKFAAAFRATLSGVPGLSWVDNYQARIIHLDELCVNAGQKLMQMRKEREALTESWSQHHKQVITGHAAVPEQWIYSSTSVHIAADASYSRRTGGATAYVSSLGDFSAQPAHGKSILCCELLAIQRAIEYARRLPGRVVIWSDSRLALNYIAHLDAIPTPTTRPIALTTLDTIKALLQQRRNSNKGDIAFRWIKAHTDCSSLQRILNDGADRLARHTMRNVCDGEFTPTLAAVCETIIADCMTNLAALDPHTVADTPDCDTPDTDSGTASDTSTTSGTAAEIGVGGGLPHQEASPPPDSAHEHYDGDHDIDSCG